MALCSIEGCDSTVKYTERGWCNKHYQRWKRHSDPLIGSDRLIRSTCSILGCSRKHYAKGVCCAHYRRLNNSKSLKDPIKVRRPNGKGGLDGRGYLRVTVDGVRVYKHRHVWEQVYGAIPAGYDVHHKNGDRLDNRLENLKCAPKSVHMYGHAMERSKSLGNTVTHKRCPCCSALKRRDEFPADASNHDGLYGYCKSCNRKRRKNRIKS